MEMTEHLQRSLPESSIFNGLKPNSFYSPDKTAEWESAKEIFYFPRFLNAIPCTKLNLNEEMQLDSWQLGQGMPVLS